MLDQTVLRDCTKRSYPIIALLVGFLTFFVIAEFFVLFFNEAFVFAIPISSILMFGILGLTETKKLIYVGIGSFLCLWAGMMVSIVFAHSLERLLGSVLSLDQLERMDPGGIILIVFISISFGVFIALFAFRKTRWRAVAYFSGICGIAAIPVALFFLSLNAEEDMLFSMLFGIPSGLAIGLYRYRSRGSLIVAAILIAISILVTVRLFIVTVIGS